MLTWRSVTVRITRNIEIISRVTWDKSAPQGNFQIVHH